MHLERLLQGGSGGSAQPTAALVTGGAIGSGGTELADGPGPADLVPGQFSSALDLLAAGLSVDTGSGNGSANAASDSRILAELIVPSAAVGSDIGFIPVADQQRVAGQAGSGDDAAETAGGSPLAEGQIEGAIAPGIILSGIDAAALAGADRREGAVSIGEPTLADGTPRGDPPLVFQGPSSLPHAEALSTLSGGTPRGDLPVGFQGPGSVPRAGAVAAGGTPEGVLSKTQLAAATGVSPGETAAGVSSTKDGGTAVEPGTGASAERAAGLVRPTIGPGSLGGVATSTVGATPAAVAGGTPSSLGGQVTGEVAPPAIPSSAAEADDMDTEAERAPSGNASARRAATRHEAHAEPAILVAARTRSEVRAALREDATAITGARGEASTAPATAAAREGSGLVAGIVEEATAGSVALRTGGDASVAPALQVLAREADLRQRSQSLLARASGGTSSGADAATPGTSPQAAPPSSTTMSARVDQPPAFAGLAERIVDALHLSAVRGGSEIRLRVEPHGLGHIDVRVQLEENGVRAMIVAEHESTRALISSHQHLLEAALGRSELRLSGFSVDVSLDQGATDYHEAEQGGDDNSSAVLEHANADTESTDGETRSGPLETGRLNLRV